ncbi:MAG: glycerol dehydrogenase [Elusimicrobia bacterium]|nr:glycerol dehydrogenase [Elusimicrobiota bacterium]
MKKVIAWPRKYVQGPGLLAEAPHYVGLLGKRPLLLWGRRSRSATHDILLPGMRAAGLDALEVLFPGECTKSEARRVAEAAAGRKADMVVGIGGGKVIDAAKAAAAGAGLPMVSIPTIASNDAPTSACTVWYDDRGACAGFEHWKFNPDLVLVDTAVIAQAPARFLVAGMGDALATWPEARAAQRGRSITAAGGTQTMTALAIAELCFDTLMECGLDAKRSAERREVTPALEKVVEANILLSGIGWESGGLACAHAVANALPALSETHGCLHGEKVAFGLMTQLCLEGDLRKEEVLRIAGFMVAAGLPVTLKDLGLAGVAAERLRGFAELVAAEGSVIHSHGFRVTAGQVVEAMRQADALGMKRKRILEVV